MFGHDTAMALRGAAALVNTGPSTPTAAVPAGTHDEGLPDVDALVRFLDAWRWTGWDPPRAEDLVRVREVRDRLRRWWSAGQDAVVADVNELFAACAAVPRVVRHDDYGWHLHALPDTAPVDRRMAVEAALAVVDLLRTDDLARLGVCVARGCDRVLVDLSRNRSRRFCSDACADRTHATAHRARRAQGGGQCRD